MHNMSMAQALSNWSDLERAYYDDNSYGGDEAEIYVSRGMPYASTWLKEGSGLLEEINAELAEDANRSLYRLFKEFAKKREVEIEVEGRPLGEWMVDPRYRHRWHVKVVHQD